MGDCRQLPEFRFDGDLFIFSFISPNSRGAGPRKRCTSTTYSAQADRGSLPHIVHLVQAVTTSAAR